MSEELFDSADALILPAVGTDDDGKIIAVFSDRELILTDEHIARLPKHCTSIQVWQTLFTRAL